MPNSLHLTLFGSPEVRRHGQIVTSFRTSKAQALLYYLAVTGRPHTRATLAGLLWGDQPEDAARASLSKCLSNLRDLLDDAVLIERQTAAFNRNYPYHLDTERFTVDLHPPLTPATLPTVQAALALYRGDFLEGFYVRDAPDFEQWLLVQRAYYREAVINGLHALAGFHEQQGDLPNAITHTRRLLTLEPWREEAHRQLMTLLARSGQRAAALAQFESCQRILEEELAVEPAAETVTLVEAIRADKVIRGSGAKVNEVQNHPVALAPDPLGVSPLPIPPTPLIGRERELVEVSVLLADPQGRLLTLLGAGGMGKSRLALAIAEQALVNRYWRDGVCLVALAGIDDVQALLPTLLTALAMPPESRQGTPESQKRCLLDFLANKEILLILDNFEQLLEGRMLVSELLAALPGLHILVTSRERLHLRAEQIYPISGLLCPVTVADEKAPAMTLLQYIARRNQPHFRPDEHERGHLVRICQLTAGMPLALELAAGWLHLFSSAAIAEAIQVNLDLLTTTLVDMPERHRSMRAVFATTWQFLSPAERRRLAWLSVFRGGFTRQAAQQVADATLIQLNQLVDKSLLDYRRAADRYELHELLRQYSLEQLLTFGEVTNAQHRHAHYFLELAERSVQEVRGPQQKEWLDCLDREIDNISAALSAMLTQEPVTALWLATALGPFFRRRRNAEGWHWLPMALTAAPGMSPLRARALMFAGSVARLNGHPDEAQRWLEESVSFWRTQDDPDNLAQALRHLGWVYYTLDSQQALLYFEESVALFRQVGDRQRIGQSLTDFAFMLDHITGAHAQAAQYVTEALALMRAAGDQSGLAAALLMLANFLDLQGEYKATAPLYEEALKISQFLDNKRNLIKSLVNIAENCLHRQEYAQSCTYADQALMLAQKMPGNSEFLLLVWHHLGLAKLALGNAVQSQTCLTESLHLAQQHGNTKMIARSLAGLGGVAVARQQWNIAVCQLSAAYRQFDQEPPFLAPPDHQLYQTWIAAARSAMSEQQFAGEWMQGQTMTLEAAVKEALWRSNLLGNL